MFWTDTVQASERLVGTVVCYDKKPVYVNRVESRSAQILRLSPGYYIDYENIPLSDKKWNDFRDLPKLGWFNFVTRDKVVPYFIERKAVNSRNHGLTASNTNVFVLNPDGLVRDRYAALSDFLRNEGYHETMNSEESFPNLSEILMSLDETPGGVAFSSKFCVVVTSEGMKWLFRRNRRIGFFTGTDSLNLFPKNGYFKEELQSCPTFDISNVREF